MDEKKKKLAWRALLSRRNLFLIAVANLILSLVNVWSTHNLLMKSSSSSSSSSSESYFLTSFFENEDVNRIKSSSLISQRVPSILDSRLHHNRDNKINNDNNNKNIAVSKLISTTIKTTPVIKSNNISSTSLNMLLSSSSSSSKNTTIKDEDEQETPAIFVRYGKVVIVTKIHGPHQWKLVLQSMCLLHFAYNNKVLYDIIIFTTEPIPETDIESLRKTLADVNVNVVVDNKGLQEEIAALSPARYENFMGKCNVTSPTSLTWFSKCDDGVRLAYNWQAEFRSIHLWHHPSLAQYKYMMWLDTDGFCTKEWANDPMEYFIKNDGVIMFDHFPQANSKYWIQSRIYDAFNSTICRLKLSKETGNLVPELGDGKHCRERGIPNIHGFFHITNLDFYRSQPVIGGLKTVHGDCFLCRFPDDQLAVTVPAAILAPERSWEMRSKGFKLDVFHNFMLDGIDYVKPSRFVNYWKTVVKPKLSSTDSIHTCPITEND